MTAVQPLGARELVDLHESGLDPKQRRALGAHYTPQPLAERLVDLAVGHLGHVPRRLCDPSCGAGAVLLAAAEHLVSLGVPVREVLERRLIGFDIDPGAVSSADGALRRWAFEHGVEDPPSPRVWVGDALDPYNTQAVLDVGPIDIVVGNPPFASPLSAGWIAATREGGGHPGGGSQVGGAYTDDSAAHLLAAVELVGSGAVVCMLQPQSLLGARDAGGVRAELLARADLVALWATDEQLFDAGVEVCAPVLVRRGGPDRAATGAPSPHPPVAVLWRDHEPVKATTAGPNWSPLLAAVLGVPEVRTVADVPVRTLGDLARCTAGFRDEFYALAEVAFDLDDTPAVRGDPESALDPEDTARLVTSGMIDPATLRWGERSRRLAGRSVLRPVVSMIELEAHSPKVGRWARRRAVPKVLVASQTRVIEAVVDRLGDCLPVTPVISVEPVDPDVSPELLAAVLSAPSTSARIASGAAGTGLSTGSLRIRAASLGELGVPEGAEVVSRAIEAWRELEALSKTDDIECWRRAGRQLDLVLGADDPAVLDWWIDRLPGRRPAARS